MTTSASTLKALKAEDGLVGPVEQPSAVRSKGLLGRLLTWRQAIWRRRWLSLATAWLVCIGGWAIIALWPTHYNASGVLYANLSELADRNVKADAPGLGPVAQLKTMLLADDTLDRIRDAVPLDPEKSQSLRSDIFLRSTVPPLFAIAYEHEDPEVAQKVLDLVVAGFQARLDETLPAAGGNLAALDQEIADQERLLQASDAGLAAFRSSNVDHLGGSDGRASELALLKDEIRRLEDQIAATIADRDAIAETLAEAPAAPETAETGTSRTPADVATERRALQVELVKLQERYADTHPFVVAVFDAIAALDTEAETLAPVAEEVEVVDREALQQRHSDLITEVSELNSRLENERREIELLQALTGTTSSVEAELAELETERAALQNELTEMQRRRGELGEGIGGDAEQDAFRLIKQPELPTDPVGPSRLMALAAVLLGGSGLGALAAVICNRYKGVFESAWQLGQRFDVGVLGTISEVLTPAERKRLSYSQLAFGLACVALVGMFSGLAIAEVTDQLAPLGDRLRTQLLG